MLRFVIRVWNISGTFFPLELAPPWGGVGSAFLARLTKENQKRKIDACVALSFAVLAAVQYGRPAAQPKTAGRRKPKSLHAALMRNFGDHSGRAFRQGLNMEISFSRADRDQKTVKFVYKNTTPYLALNQCKKTVSYIYDFKVCLD